MRRSYDNFQSVDLDNKKSVSPTPYNNTKRYDTMKRSYMGDTIYNTRASRPVETSYNDKFFTSFGSIKNHARDFE